MTKLICFDMDGVLFRVHNFWMKLHEVLDTLEEGRKLTDKYLLTDYDKLVEKVVHKLWRGKPAQLYLDLINEVEMYGGVTETLVELKERGYKIAIITCGPKQLMERLEGHYDYGVSNELIVKNGEIARESYWPVAEGREKKVKILEKICNELDVEIKDVIAIADGKSDLEMLEAVGVPIAFCPTSEAIVKIAKYVVKEDDLRKILKLV